MGVVPFQKTSLAQKQVVVRCYTENCKLGLLGFSPIIVNTPIEVVSLAHGNDLRESGI